MDIIMSILYAVILLRGCFALMGDLEYDTKLNIRVDHSFDDSSNPVFTRRGDIFAKSVHSDIVTFKQTDLSEDDIAALKASARRNGKYRLRALAKMSDGKEYLFFTFAKACSLVESHLNDVLFINLDSIGNVIAITLATSGTCIGAPVEKKYLTSFNTTVIVRHMDIGPIPDTASYIQKLEKEREAKERGEGKDNRSFLSKYWMYIIPVVILLLISSTSNNEAAGGGQR
ncbi:UNVERIFIED_CONTAM: hypothetical protein PYX00_006067 [Menopon gallinae]|uniref:ER membrane protein complex subunit 10 n=1 Tax=Menopon gallinae TaxID=328185 RepID=A0AAW2HV65_9NEOP